MFVKARSSFNKYLLVLSLFYILFGWARPCEKIVFVNQTDKTLPCQRTPPNILHCSSLTEVLKILDLNNTCIYIQSNVTLNETINIDSVNDLSITTYGNGSDRTAISCTNQSNLLFSNCHFIRIRNLVFQECGSNVEFQWKETNLVNISAAVSFLHSSEVHLENLTFLFSDGYALLLSDVDSISIAHITVLNSVQVLIWYQGKYYTSGGGVFIYWVERNSNSISITNSSFVGTYALSQNVSDATANLPYAKGAAVTIFFGESTQNNTVHFENNIARDNKAYIGTGLYVEFAKKSSGNQVLVSNVTMEYNMASMFGGSIFISQNSKGNNFFFLRESRLSNNQASVGGAISLVRPNVKSEIERAKAFILDDVTMYGNEANLGSAIHLNNVLVNLINVNISWSNSRSCDVSPGQGSVFALRSTLNFTGDFNVFQHNNNSAVVLDSSEMYAYGTINFLSNIGYNGGAIAFYEHALLFLTMNSHLTFDGNRATNAGGAIYVLTPGPSLMPWSTTELNMYHCFILFHDTSVDSFNGTVIFNNNNCTYLRGRDIYASSLQSCRLPGQKRLEIITSWKNFIFTGNSTKVSTNAVHMRPLEYKEWLSYPGALLHPHIVLTDERENNVSESVAISFKPDGVAKVESNPTFVVDDDESIKLSLLNQQPEGVNQSFMIRVRTTSDVFLEEALMEVTFSPCQFGYVLQNGACECDLINNEENGIAMCDSDNIYLEANRWVNPNEKSSYVCPMGYCHGKRSGNTTYVKGEQCVGNRAQNSRLCSECLPGYSAVTASFSCQLCKRNNIGWIWVSLVTIVGLSLLILLVMAMNIDIMSYNINICLYAYEVIDLLYTSDQKIDGFLSFIMSVFQVTPINSVYPSYCLWNGMNALHKIAYGYLIPTWMSIFMTILYFVVRNKRKWLERWYQTMSIVWVMCFSDFIRVSFELLHYITIDNKKYLFRYAAVEYFGNQHLGYGIVAIFVLILIALSSIAQIVLLLRVDIYLFEWLRRFEDKVSAYFKVGRKWFWIFYFVCRLEMYAIGIFFPSEPILQMSLLGMSCFLITVILSFVRPFKDDFINTVESVVSTTLTVITVLSMGIKNLYFDQKHFITCIHVLSYVPFLAVVLTAVRKFPALKKILKRRSLARRASAIYHPVRVFENYEDHNRQYQRIDDGK